MSPFMVSRVGDFHSEKSRLMSGILAPSITDDAKLPNVNDKSSSGIAPSSGGIASGKYGDKVADVFASNAQEKNEKYQTDLPAQHETASSNHTSVPQPVITTLSQSSKDRTQPSLADHASKPISSDPAVDPKMAKDQAKAEIAQTTSSGYPLPSTFPVPTAAPTGPEPSRSYIKKDAPVSGLPLSQTTVPTSGKDAIPPATPSKTVAPPIVAAAPSTPSNKRNSVFASTPSTAASTPIKGGAHSKESSAQSENMRKRKSSFFAKVSQVSVSPKQKKFRTVCMALTCICGSVLASSGQERFQQRQGKQIDCWGTWNGARIKSGAKDLRTVEEAIPCRSRSGSGDKRSRMEWF